MKSSKNKAQHGEGNSMDQFPKWRYDDPIRLGRYAIVMRTPDSAATAFSPHF